MSEANVFCTYQGPSISLFFLFFSFSAHLLAVTAHL